MCDKNKCDNCPILNNLDNWNYILRTERVNRNTTSTSIYSLKVSKVFDEIQSFLLEIQKER